MRYTKTLTGLGICVGAAIGAYAVTAAMSGNNLDEPPPADQAPIAGDLIFTGDTADLEPTFNFALSNPAATPNLAPAAPAGDLHCVLVTYNDGEGGPFEACTDRDTIATGLAHLIRGQADGTFLLAGTVPDEVDTILVDNEPVDFDGNLWSAVLPDDAPRTLTVGNSQTDVWVELEPARPATN